jgi:anthranilate phosphoribosyltransferase
MLKQQNIGELLSGKLQESELRKRLLELTPDKLDADTLKQYIKEVRAFCSPDFAKLSGLGANAMDCSGTGGSGRPRFNTSTASAFVISAAKIPVAKFGNRAATSKSGSFDVLNAMGISEKISAKSAARILDAAGLVFLFAPQAYPALGALTAVRATLGASTLFNFIGPLLNPVSPVYRMMGVADPLMQKLLTVLIKESATSVCSMIVRSACGLDEICPCCGTDLEIVRGGKTESVSLNGSGKVDDCKTGKPYTPGENAEIMIRVFQGQDTESYEYELTCQNAGAGIFVGGKAKSMDEGIEMARELLASGQVQSQLDKVKQAYAEHT